MQDWLDKVAKRDPAKALDLLARLAEFLVPKLSRSELRGAGDDGRLIIEIIPQGGPPASEET